MQLFIFTPLLRVCDGTAYVFIFIYLFRPKIMKVISILKAKIAKKNSEICRDINGFNSVLKKINELFISCKLSITINMRKSLLKRLIVSNKKLYVR